MEEFVQGSSGDPDPVAYGVAEEPLDGKFVDEAVETTLRSMDLSMGTCDLLKDMLSRDSNSAIATSYFDDYNAKGLARSMLRVRKARLFIDYVLSDEQVMTLIEYAPEYELIFRSIDLHDHPMAAAMRIIDHAVINSRVPAMSKVCDVGGDVLYHIRQGNINVHCCNPDEDGKDDARAVVKDLAIRTMYKSIDSFSNETRIMLNSYMDCNTKHFCRRRAQNCGRLADVITSIHVYDIPMGDWPAIMERKAAKLVEGCVIFSDKFLNDAYGELKASGVRYEIDRKSDVFRMGFINSPSWWYHHKWSEFLRYAVDQRMVYGDNVYSYKVVERRNDTIYFRILAVPCKPDEFSESKFIRHYAYPDVRMVEVNGFDFSSDGSISTRDVLRRRTIMVAVPLWENLVNEATLQYERNSLDFTKMYNAYRTAAPRHTINGVLISGGYSVDVDLMKLVVVHAAVAGASRAILSEKTNRAMTAGVFAQRARLTQGTGKKLLDFLLDTLRIASIVPAYVTGLTWLARFLGNKINDLATMNFIAEMYEPEIKSVCCSKIFVVADNRNLVASTAREFPKMTAKSLIHDLLLAANNDPKLAADFLEGFGPQLNPSQSKQLETVVDRAKSLAKQVKSAAAGVDTKKQPENQVDSNVFGPFQHRIKAIEEAIVEVKLERQITDNLCKRMYSQFVLGNRSVNHSALTRDLEANENPDLWRITNGVLANHSERGIPVRDFNFARIYLGNADSSGFVKVTKHVWHNDRTGIDEINYRLDETDFSGYGLTCDSLVIFNGSEILSALENSLSYDHSKYDVILNEGPPGCGKTYAIINSYTPTDMILCPVKQSIEDTKSQLLEKFGDVITSRDCARTVDSLLIHGIRSKVSFARILADECFMTHAGKWYACAALLGVDNISAFGDTKQIPHVPRVQCSSEHVSLVCNSRTFNSITRRCPADSVACWGHLYEGLNVKTTNSILNSISETEQFQGLQVTKDTCLMGMYQADKKEIRKLYPNHERVAGKGKLITVHESEGKTFKEVILFRFDRRIRHDKLSLYDRAPYVLVALSRHTHKLTYVRAPGLNDLVSKFISNCKNPKLVRSKLVDPISPNG